MRWQSSDFGLNIQIKPSSVTLTAFVIPLDFIKPIVTFQLGNYFHNRIQSSKPSTKSNQSQNLCYGVNILKFTLYTNGNNTTYHRHCSRPVTFLLLSSAVKEHTLRLFRKPVDLAKVCLGRTSGGTQRHFMTDIPHWSEGNEL